MGEKIENVGTSQMDEVKITNYDEKYLISDVFINDLRICLGEMEYVKANPYIEFARKKKDGIYVAEMDEFFKKLEYLPYRYIYPMIANLKNKEILNKYFTLIKNEQTEKNV